MVGCYIKGKRKITRKQNISGMSGLQPGKKLPSKPRTSGFWPRKTGYQVPETKILFSIFLPKLLHKYLFATFINMLIIAITIKVRTIGIKTTQCICFLIKLVCNLKDLKAWNLLFLSKYDSEVWKLKYNCFLPIRTYAWGY